MKFGLILEKRKEEDYFLGGILSKLPKIVLQSDGQWDDYLPLPEFQNLNFIETQNCVSFGTTSILEILIKRKYGDEENFSDRQLGITADTNPYGGNTPNAVAQAVRHFGLIPEEMLPFYGSKPEEYYKPKPLTEEYVKEGEKFLKEYEVLHEWVDTDKIKEALKYSPVAISVTAWFQKDGVYYKPDGMRDNHYCICYGYNDKGWKIFDSYDNVIKLYSYDADISMAKRFHIERVQNLPLKKSSKYSIIRFIKWLWNEIWN